MSKPTIYLAGPMTGLTWEQATQWREKAALILTPSWRVVTPVKGQLQSAQSDVITASTMDDTQEHLPLAHTATGITAQDEFYVRQSDWVLANFTGSTRVSQGTVWELGFAWGLGKQIISVIPKGDVHDHPFIRRRSHVFVQELDEAIEYLRDMAI